jgi:hypothetical protein
LFITFNIKNMFNLKLNAAKNDLKLFILLPLFCVILALKVAFTAKYPFPFAAGDEVYWYQASKSFFAAGFWTSVKIPSGFLHSLLFSPIWRSPSAFHFIATTTQAILFAVPAFFLALLIADEKIAIGAAILTLLMPAQLYTWLFISENFLWFFTAVTFLLQITALKKRSPRWFQVTLGFLFVLPMIKASGFFTVVAFLAGYAGTLYLGGSHVEPAEKDFLRARLRSVAIFIALFIVRYFLLNGKSIAMLGAEHYVSITGQMVDIHRYFANVPYLLKLGAGHLLTLTCIFGGGIYSFVRLKKNFQNEGLFFFYVTLILALLAHVAFSILFTYISSQPVFPGEYDRIHVRYYFHLATLVYVIGLAFLNRWTPTRKQKVAVGFFALLPAIAFITQFYPAQFHAGSLIDSLELFWYFWHIDNAPFSAFIHPMAFLVVITAFQFGIIFFKKYSQLVIGGGAIIFLLMNLMNFETYQNFGNAQNGTLTACAAQFKGKINAIPDGALQLNGPDFNHVSSLLFVLPTAQRIEIGDIQPRNKTFYLTPVKFHAPQAALFICTL